MNINFKIFSVLFFCLIFLSCNEKNKQTIINGDIPNLPNGTLYLYMGSATNRIDSVATHNGKFTLIHKWEKDANEPVYLGIDHVDKIGVLRAFVHPTNAKNRGSGWYSSNFFSDSLITIKGSITDFNQISLKLSKKFKFVISPKIKCGYQTKALYNIDADFFDPITIQTYSKVAKKIEKYPNSFHLLYEIAKRKNSFSTEQIKNFLNLFRGDIVESESLKNLQAYNEKRINKKKLSLPILLDNNGIKTKILDDKFKKHLVVFWASWCSPCRQEIPLLKKMYEINKKNIEFVSISTDKNSSFWQKALAKEQMSWKQLIVNKNSKEHEILEIYFQLNQSIPYIVLVDNNMKVLKSHLGSMSEIEINNFIKD